MVQQRINQRARPVAWGGVDNKTGRFVDHDQCIVFVENLKRNRLGFGLGRLRFRYCQRVDLALRDPVLRLGDRVFVRCHCTGADKRLQAAA
jgi:hypothetical protein